MIKMSQTTRILAGLTFVTVLVWLLWPGRRVGPMPRDVTSQEYRDWAKETYGKGGTAYKVKWV